MTEQFWKLGSNINATNRSQRPRTDALMPANLLKVTKVIHGSACPLNPLDVLLYIFSIFQLFLILICYVMIYLAL